MNSLFVVISVGIMAQAQYEPTIDLPIPPLPTAEVSTRPLGQPVVKNDTPISGGCYAAPGGCANAGYYRYWYCIKPTGDLIQHQSLPGSGSYYYFRPYNTSQLIKQRASAVSSGTDSRMPYSNSVFRQVYETVEPQFLLRMN